MIRNYVKGSFESLDSILVNTGIDIIPIKHDGFFPNAFSDLEIYTDSGRTIALSAADWEYSTIDNNKTAIEAEIDGSGKIIYSQIRILNPSYTATTLYITFNNFGVYVDGGAIAGGAQIGGIIFSAVPKERFGFKWCDYQTISQTNYPDLFNEVGHLFAKTSTDVTAAESAGNFHVPDGNLLFARGGKSWSISDSAINISTERITVTAHGLATDGSMDGRAIKLQRWAGQSPTMPVGSDYTEYDQNYIRVIDANTIELYASEAEAINTATTTGRVNFSSAGTGTFMLTTMGCYQSDAFQGWQSGGTLSGSVRYGALQSAGNQTANSSQSGHATPRYALDSIIPPGISSKITAVTDGINGTPRSTNETRPSYASLGMQIRVE